MARLPNDPLIDPKLDPKLPDPLPKDGFDHNMRVIIAIAAAILLVAFVVGVPPVSNGPLGPPPGPALPR